MPIPAFDATGLLPTGIHDGTIEEIAARFAASPDRRSLWETLLQYLAELRRWPLAQELLLDGSFVTSEPAPHDIDAILVLRDDYDLTQEVSPFEYNLRSHSMIKRTYGLDVFVVRPRSPEYYRFLDLFSQVRDSLDVSKGLVRVRL